MFIEELIPNLNLEDYNNEFKGIIEEGKKEDGSRKEYSWLRTIVAFANSNGGNMFIGVENKTHKIISFSHQETDKLSLMIQRLIKEKIEPQITYKIYPIQIPSTLPSRYILRIEIKKSEFPLVSLKENGINAIYLRKFAKNSIASPQEIIDLVSNSSYVSYDSRFTNEIFKKEDFTQLFSYYKEVNKKELTIKELISIGFINENYELSYGGLLFKDNLKSEKTLVECTWFKGYNKGNNVFLASKTLNSNLLEEFFEIIEFIQNHSANGFEKKDLSRIDYIAYPLDALKEAVANALGHRNYFINGSQIEINIFKDRVEFISPGSLLNTNQELKEFKDLASIPPLRRNEVICSTFTLLKLMEKKGSGFDKIITIYKPYGDNFAPFINTSNQYFSLTLIDLTRKEGYMAQNETPSISLNVELEGKHDLKILSYCYNKERTVSEIANHLNIKPTTYFREKVLNNLVNKKYLIKNDTSFPTKYYTNITKVNLD